MGPVIGRELDSLTKDLRGVGLLEGHGVRLGEVDVGGVSEGC